MKYADWIKENWSITGGLITQADAGKILGKTRTRIRQMINEGKLKAYRYENDPPFVSYADVIKLLNTQGEEKKKHIIDKIFPWSEKWIKDFYDLPEDSNIQDVKEATLKMIKNVSEAKTRGDIEKALPKIFKQKKDANTK